MIPRLAAGLLLLAALAAGTASDVPRPAVRRTMGGYHVLATDFHVHSFPFSWSTLSPQDTVVEARYQGLDAVVLTPHDDVRVAKAGKAFADAAAGSLPIVVVGEEITSPSYHLLAAGITERVAALQPVERAIDEIHRQGGVAIAAHPYRGYWPGYDAEAMRKLDGAEIVRPETASNPALAAELREFSSRGTPAAIGATDYHGFGPVGWCRTYVFARTRSPQGIVDAVREGRTVVMEGSSAYGDPALIRLAAGHGGLPGDAPVSPLPGAARWFSRFATAAGLVVFFFFNRWSG